MQGCYSAWVNYSQCIDIWIYWILVWLSDVESKQISVVILNSNQLLSMFKANNVEWFKECSIYVNGV